MDRFARTTAVIMAIVVANTAVDMADGRNVALVIWCGVAAVALIALAVFWPTSSAR